MIKSSFYTILSIAVSFNALSQTLYAPNGSVGTSTNTNVGVGTTAAPAEKLHVAGNLQIGSSEPYTSGTYHINMPAGSGTINGGNGRELILTAGSSDNAAAARGGNLILRPGVPVSPSTTYGNIALADNGGKVGIGTTGPQAFLDIAANLDVTTAPGKLGIVLGRLQEGAPVGDGTFLGVRGYGTSTTLFSGKSFALEHNFYGITNSSINFYRGLGTTGGFLTFHTNNNVERMRITAEGNIAIGTTDPKNYKLAIAGKAIAEEIVVKLQANWPDYVFEKDYNLRSLFEVENFINTNKHLPEVPAAKEMEANGVNLGEMNMLLLKKVEELTLYVIELKKENEKQQLQIKALENK
jgi:hypothetical protein